MVIPCYRVAGQVLDVLARVGHEVERIYCIDDACPEGSGRLIRERVVDPRVEVVVNPANLGVGGATMVGYRRAVEDGAEVIVKLDGDGQMDPSLLPQLVAPVVAGQADYAKGNRFWDLGHIGRMPFIRRVGNLALSFMAKASTGYWNVFDPTNGYTAIHARLLEWLPLERVSPRYFFESDLLFRLGTLRAVVVDVPMDARYGHQTSSLQPWGVASEFAWKHLRNFVKRLGYNYFLRDLSIASLQLLAALALLAFAGSFGGWQWWWHAKAGVTAPLGTVMLAALPAVMGFQLLLSFIGYDMAGIPSRAVWPMLPRQRLR
ncbi:glycosyltransferase family 2 protein [Silanimonas sp.]|uniref:glycosyltransferase family 2 protein n=1 Tax=Silanimonas sp. TaxID=1929290 RepID=UPI0037C8A697